MLKKMSRVHRLSVIAAVTVFAVMTTIAAFAANGGEATVSFERDVQSLFDNNCVFCHMTGAASGSLNLEPGASYENLVGVKSSQSDLNRVEANEPEKSYLLHKLQGTHLEAGGSGSQMPLAGTPFNEDQLQIIRQWILEGALNN